MGQTRKYPRLLCAPVVTSRADVVRPPRVRLAPDTDVRIAASFVTLHLRGRCHVLGAHRESEPVMSNSDFLLRAHAPECGRGQLARNHRLYDHGVVAREQNDPVGCSVKPAYLLLSRGHTRLGRVCYQKVGARQSGSDANSRSVTTTAVSRPASFPASGESLIVASDVATPPPKLAPTRHWLRTMLR